MALIFATWRYRSLKKAIIVADEAVALINPSRLVDPRLGLGEAPDDHGGLDAIPAATLLIDANGLIEFANRGVETIIGYDRTQLSHRLVTTLLPKRYEKRVRDLLTRLPSSSAQTLTRKRYNLYALNAEGREFPLRCKLSIVDHLDRRLLRCTLVDFMSQRRGAAATDYLSAIVESSDDAIIGKDLNGTILSWNRGAEIIFGYRPDEIVGQSICILFPPHLLDEEHLILKKIINGERLDHYETVRLHKDGHDIPVSLTVSPIRDSGGTIIGASKILRNIGERLAAERALARSEAEFRACFEGAAVGKILADPASRRMLRINPAFAQMLGYETHELVGRLVSDVTWPEDRALDAQSYALFLSGGTRSHVVEMRYSRRDGTPLWVRLSATFGSVVRCDQPAFLIVSVEDIDARHKAQAQLVETNLNLERALTERTIALEQRDLLLREVYHRVKNNLQIVDGFIALQAHRLQHPALKEVCLSLRGRVFALGLVHQQLMGSHDLQTFDIALFLQELSQNIMESRPEEGVNLSVDAAPLQVGLDFAVPLGLVVNELVTNSLKHAFPGREGHICVVLRPDGDGKVLVIVSDDGQGHQSGTSRGVPVTPGLGVGIVKRLVTQLGGTMSVRNDKGTTTEIRIAAPLNS